MNASHDITMYSTTFCPFCDRARSLFTRKNVTVREIKVDEDASQRTIMLERSNGQRTVPQIFIGKRHVGGFTELYELERKGELDPLLHSVVFPASPG